VIAFSPLTVTDQCFNPMEAAATHSTATIQDASPLRL
jgi:hypothetical protein